MQQRLASAANPLRRQKHTGTQHLSPYDSGGYVSNGLWSKVVRYIANKVSFGTVHSHAEYCNCLFYCGTILNTEGRWIFIVYAVISTHWVAEINLD